MDAYSHLFLFEARQKEELQKNAERRLIREHRMQGGHPRRWRPLRKLEPTPVLREPAVSLRLPGGGYEVVIQVENLVKRYGAVTAVNSISFDVVAGSIFAFLGSNGAGKTTTINCLTTIDQADSGHLRINGRQVGPDNEAIRRDIGVVFQDSVLDHLLTVRENLRTRARLYHGRRPDGDRRIAELSGLIAIDSFLDQRYGTLSGGQRRRVDIARALIHDPAIIFLDEPTAGLDPRSRENVWNTIERIRIETGLTVFLTTHYMEETERADDIIIIDRGRVVARGTPASLRARYSRDRLTVRGPDLELLDQGALRAGHSPRRSTDAVEIAVRDSAQALAFLETHEDHIDDFEFQHGRMDDVFIALTRAGEKK